MTDKALLVVPVYQAHQYTGANGQKIADDVDGAELIRDTGELLVIEVRPPAPANGFPTPVNRHNLAVGMWIIWREIDGLAEVFALLDDATYRSRYATLPTGEVRDADAGAAAS